MKPFLVDVPVKINIWIRPECQKKQFEVIKQARPSILFLQSDGGRNEKEWEAIRQNRKMLDDGIDWDCKVYRLYEDHNNGLYAMGRKTASLIWQTVDRCILLEDDIIPSVSFFRYCAELLEKYKDDKRIECICGMNHMGVYDKVNADYFFSSQGSIWGTAVWRDRFMERGDFSYAEDPYLMSLIKGRCKDNPMAWKRIEAYAHQEKFEGHVPGGEFWIDFAMYAKNRVQIVPKYNMICNIGKGDDSEHFKNNRLSSEKRPIFNMKTYELSFPLVHPKCVISDEYYAKMKMKILGYNKSFPRLRSAFGHLFKLDFKYFAERIKRVLGKGKKDS